MIDFGFSIYQNAEDYIYWRCGTPGYIAPEVYKLTEKHKYTVQADMYSLGYTLMKIIVRSNQFTPEQQKSLHCLLSDTYKFQEELRKMKVNKAILDLI